MYAGMKNGSATALCQLAFFARFLEAAGLFARWVNGRPLAYTNPNAPAVVDLLGTWLLSILDERRRYAYIAWLQEGEIAPEILGMIKIVSDERLHRALAPSLLTCCDEAQRAACLVQVRKSTIWMGTMLSERICEALNTA